MRVSKSPKVIHGDNHYCPIDVGSYALTGAAPSKILVHEKKVLPPPPFPKRSTVKGLRWWVQDPFLAAYKECTKSGENGKLSSEDGGSKFARKKKIDFSCKESCDVRDDNLVRISNLPPLPKDGIRLSIERLAEIIEPYLMITWKYIWKQTQSISLIAKGSAV
ncbi:hypothetical protein F3Y22_tig00111088pilonHSYRG00445 [Hibiscus syriacus]|uniref:Uncharacterized protein n=1 Tax=Hibiscus syriacus TaxID=106335 RepID=A0A6A2Z2V2_HIBSY|nr:hypothetical protein F3Y22_tig00111088pilonHSYRG00445 [Hibiscus syriacus]